MPDATLTYDSVGKWIRLTLAVSKEVELVQEYFDGYLATDDGIRYIMDWIKKEAKNQSFSMSTGNRWKGMYQLLLQLDRHYGTSLASRWRIEDGPYELPEMWLHDRLAMHDQLPDERKWKDIDDSAEEDVNDDFPMYLEYDDQDNQPWAEDTF